MAGNTTVDTSTPIAFRAHHYIKNIETANLGKYYSTITDNLNYYIVDCIAKPAINRAPEWTYNNRVVDSIKTHRTLSLAIAGTIAVALFIYVVYLMHPKKADTSPKIPETDPKTGGTPEKTPPGPEGAKPGEPTPDAKGKKPEGADGAAAGPNGADLKEKTEKKDEEKKAGDSPEKHKKKAPPSLDTEKSLLASSSSSEDASDTPKANEEKERKASDPGKPSGSSSATPPLTAAPSPTPAAPSSAGDAPGPVGKPSGSTRPGVGDKEEFDFAKMIVEELPPKAGSPVSPLPGEKGLVDTLDKKAASGASISDALLAELESPPVSGSKAGAPPTPPKPAEKKE